MKSFAIWSINLYQRHISPRKGFRCAYGVYHNNGTCSSIIKSHIQQHGVIKAYPMIRRQFDACKIAYVALLANAQEESDWDSCWKKTKEQAQDQAVEEGTQCTCDAIGDSCTCDAGIPCDCSF
mgnify:CR=1 FL=1